MTTRARRWTGTTYRGMPPDYDEKTMNWMCFQLETCPTSGRLHWQFAFELIKGRTLQGAKRALNDNAAHIEESRGTAAENRSYCSKPESAIVGTYLEFGEPRSGNSESKGCLDRALQCKSLAEVREAEPKAFVLYGRGLDRLFTDREESKREPPIVSIYWGPTGTYKSFCANNECPNAYWMPAPTRGKTPWFNGYNGEDSIIIDEFDPWNWDISFVLRMLDRYPLRVEIKNGFASFRAKRIIITSHFDPEDWFTGRFDEIKRRCRDIRWFGPIDTDEHDMLWQAEKLTDENIENIVCDL